MRITIELNLGNDSMQTPGDVIRVFTDLVIHLAHVQEFEPESLPLRDANGNTVGRWEVSEN